MKKRALQILSSLCLATLTFVAGSAQQRSEGTGRGTVIATTDSFPGTPLLDGFLVRFGPPLGEPSETDHHFGTIEVWPERPEPINVTVTYADDNGDDAFAYVVSFHSSMAAGVESGGTEELFCAFQCGPPIARPSPDHVFVLRGFKLYIPDERDRHVERLAVFEADGRLTVAFEQAGHFTPNSFFFQVDYAYLPPAAVSDIGELWGVSIDGVDRDSIPPGESVLRGFDFRFTDGDHHVREIGVQTPDDGRVEVFFNDKNSDDTFVWSVRWATLAPAAGPEPVQEPVPVKPIQVD